MMSVTKGKPAISPLTVPDVDTNCPALYDELLRRTSVKVIGINDEPKGEAEAEDGATLGDADGKACNTLLIDCKVSGCLAAFDFAITKTRSEKKDSQHCCAKTLVYLDNHL